MEEKEEVEEEDHFMHREDSAEMAMVFELWGGCLDKNTLLWGHVRILSGLVGTWRKDAMLASSPYLPKTHIATAFSGGGNPGNPMKPLD